MLRRATGLIGEVTALLTAATNHALMHAAERINRTILDQCDYRGPEERRAMFEASFPRVRWCRRKLALLRQTASDTPVLAGAA